LCWTSDQAVGGGTAGEEKEENQAEREPGRRAKKSPAFSAGLFALVECIA